MAFRAVGNSLDAMMSAAHDTLTAYPCCQLRGWCLDTLGTGSSSTYSLFPAFLRRHPSHLPTVAAGSAAKGNLCPDRRCLLESCPFFKRDFSILFCYF